jgi:HK97 gp10 family phage protein
VARKKTTKTPSGARVTIQVDGADALLQKLQSMPEKMRKGAERAVADEADEIAQEMRESVPVDTGALREGIQSEHDGLTGKAVSTADYSWVIEAGTHRRPARPFAQPAAERSRTRFPGRVSEYVREELPS